MLLETLQVQHRGESHVFIVDELPVDLVRDEEQPESLAQLPQRVQLLPVVDNAGGVLGGDVQDDLGPRGDVPRDLVTGGKGIPVFDGGRDGNHFRRDHGREGDIVGVKRLTHEDLITGIADGGQRKEDRLAAAHGHGHITGFHRVPVAPVVRGN